MTAPASTSQWFNWKHSAALYVISREKENLRLSVSGNLPFDRDLTVNQGVIADEFVDSPTAQVQLRRVRYKDPESGEEYGFLTMEMTLPPGVIAELYRRRWDIEKTFDSFKNAYSESKGWATKQAAKTTQAHIMCLAHNLMLNLEHRLEKEHGLVNEAENKRRSKRAGETRATKEKQPTNAAAKVTSKPASPTAPPSGEPPTATEANAKPQRHWARGKVSFGTKISVKLIRWVRVLMWSQAPWEQLLTTLRHHYSTL
jgi:hypothetical protein